MLRRPVLWILAPVLLAASCGTTTQGAESQGSAPTQTLAESSQTTATAPPTTAAATTTAPPTTAAPTTTTARPTTTTEPGFDKSQFSVDAPGSPWWMVGRDRPLTDNYAPETLAVPNLKSAKPPSADAAKISAVATEAAAEMFAAAEQDGIRLVLLSGFRSQSTQAAVFERLKNRTSLANAEKYSARPGTSEHQTGLAMDITSLSAQCQLKPCFEQTSEAMWLLDNAYRFGFHLRYPKGMQEITGYQFEPWHYRYLGIDLATELYGSSLTMEEFFTTQEIEKPLE